MFFLNLYPRDEARKNIEKTRITLDDMYKEYVDIFSEHDEEGSSRTSVDQNGLMFEPQKPSKWDVIILR